MDLTSMSAGAYDASISRIELYTLFVPFREEVQRIMRASAGGLGMAIAAEEPWMGGDFVICRLSADDGHSGVGEAFVWLPETGLIPEQITSVIAHALSRYVLGASPFAVAEIAKHMERNASRNEVAKGLLDMACYDLAGHICGQPAGELMGGLQVEEIPLAALVPLADLDVMSALTEGFREGGFRTLRIKLGAGIEQDAGIMEAVRGKAGEDTRLRVDYNQAYGPEEAVQAILAIEPYGIDVAEQPVAAEDYAGMAAVQHRVGVPLMAHEGCFSLRDIITLVELGAVGVVGINSERPGGISAALRAMDFASGRGMGVVVHNQTLGIATAAQLHLAAARFSSLGHDVELFGDVMFEDDLILEPIACANGTAAVPLGPGFGVELDEGALARYARAETVIVEI
ncbi:MAG: mandelate racemase/muconate lactonizing enzyme family protein [Actinobacteria bacterium]|nr:mandelate racemase/muconate lactonizing enzyme family protein [Actinomycetota bacterium]